MTELIAYSDSRFYFRDTPKTKLQIQPLFILAKSKVKRKGKTARDRIKKWMKKRGLK